MNFFLIYAYLFFLGSIAGWCIELVFRKYFSKSNPEHHWINPGFCTGPYLPIYGFGLCILYTISVVGEYFELPLWAIILLIVFCMTAVEYIAGIICLKIFKLRLWDYSNCWGNVQGLICPLFSFFWGVLGAFYYFVIQPQVYHALVWLSENLAFSFVIGFFFGVFTLDVIHSANLVSKIKRAADESKVVVHLEQFKEHIRKFNEEKMSKKHFLRFFKTEVDISEAIHRFYKNNHFKH